MKNKGGKPKLKRKGAANVFGCDLTEYLESSGQDVPTVLKSCAEFIETHGIVDGIYRLSGVTSNIQKLRQEFGSDQCPDLTREVYLQDIHCVGSLCKLYFRELPNPLLTYELYKKFTEAVSCFPEEDQLAQIQNAIQELPPSHYRTLEYLIKHLALLASFSGMTNMHTRNLALVWAPNLLRSKEIEAVGCSGDAAFLEVRVQQLVIEFILNHVDELFSDNNTATRPKDNDENKPVMKSLTLPPSASLPMKLVSLEEAQARSLSACHPARKERRENSLPEIVPATGSFYHTVLDLPDSKRKLSTKSKKWKSIFNLGRSGSEAKTKLSRNGSVFVRGGQKLSEKATIRPAKSMDSLCSIPAEGDDPKSHFKRTVMTGGFFVPAMKPPMGSPSSSCDTSKQETEGYPKGTVKGAEGGAEDSGENNNPRPTQVRPLPEQLKVFRAIEDPENEQTSPMMCRMFYTSNDGMAKSGFHGTLFPLEASPRHQRKALNISEPFAVSVPLRVSAVISINSTPCRVTAKDKPAFSSLQESSFLGQDGAVALVPEGDSHDRLEHVTVKEEKTPESKSLADHSVEELAVTKKLECADAQQEISTERAKDAINHCSQVLEGKENLEQEPAVKIPSSQQRTGQASQVQLGIQESLEPGDRQQEAQRDKAEDISHVRDLAQEDHSSTAMEILWPEIQQELKIVESEEELPFAVVSPEKGQQQQKFKASPTPISSSEAHNVTRSSVLPLPPLEDEKGVRNILAESDVPLCGGSSERPKDAPVCDSKVFRKQDDVSPTLPNLENTPCGVPCSKVCLENEDARHGYPPTSREQKLSSKPQESTTVSRDESMSQPSLKHVDQSEWEGKNWLLRREKDHTIDVRQAKECHSMRSDTEEQASSKTLTAVEAEHVKRINSNDQAPNPLDQQEEDTWVDHVQSLELVEPWEDHQWVTSPLHSPTFKDTLGKALQGFQPPSQGGTQGHFKKPCFSRSFSLDSKDFVKKHWAVQVPIMNTEDEHCCGDTQPSVRESSPAQWKETERVEAWLNLSEEHSQHVEASKNALSIDAALAAKEFPSVHPPSEKESHEKEVYVVKKDKEVSKLEYPLLQSNSGNSALNSTSPEETSLNVQEGDSPGAAVIKASGVESQGSKGEDIPWKERPRPSSLNLESVLPSTNLFNFESLSVPSPPRHYLCGQKEVKTSDSVPSLPVSCPSKNRTDLWGSHFDPQDVDLDYIMMAHAATGRRNSAPVSVSAVRTSFMIKLCQARAVPVIPPKIQYTQVPQPLQTQNPNCRTQIAPENKEMEANGSQCKSVQTAQLQAPKSPSLDRKGKENNNAALVDLTNRKTEPSFSNHSFTQDAPVLRRKRTSEGEATGDNPQSSKMERPSGVSKPSYRSRPGRPQSLILFSPPFPIMDHPSSSGDSRVLLSPIKSPSHTPSSSPIACDISGTASEGVTLRNKMTIPKNGPRLETSTSCFYQPQRRSVILDGRSGRQIE